MDIGHFGQLPPPQLSTWFMDDPKGFLLHSHIKRRAIIWIGCHVCLLSRSSIESQKFQRNDTELVLSMQIGL